jgi:hypothetical protein
MCLLLNEVSGEKKDQPVGRSGRIYLGADCRSAVACTTIFQVRLTLTVNARTTSRSAPAFA